MEKVDELYNFLFPDDRPSEPETVVAGSDYDFIAERESQKYGLDDRIVKSLITQESGGKPDAVSPKGATGIMQIMPQTGMAIASELGEEFSYEKLQDPETSIRWGTYLLAQNKQAFGRDDLALAAYHGGPGAIRADGTISPESNDGLIFTTDYVQSVLQRAQGLSSVPSSSEDDELSEFLGIRLLTHQEKEMLQQDMQRRTQPLEEQVTPPEPIQPEKPLPAAEIDAAESYFPGYQGTEPVKPPYEEGKVKEGYKEAMMRSFAGGAAELAYNFARIPESAAEVFVMLNNFSNRGANKLIEMATKGKVKDYYKDIPYESIPWFIKVSEESPDTKAVKSFIENQKKAVEQVTNSKGVVDNITEGNIAEASKSLGIQAAAQVPLILSMMVGGQVGLGSKALAGFAGATETSSKMDQYWNEVEKGIAKQKDPNMAVANAAVNGAIETLGESLGTGKIIEDAITALSKKGSEELAKKATGNAVGGVISSLLKAGGSEATEEAIVGYSQAVSDKIWGTRPDITFVDAVKEGIEGGLVGFVTAAGTTGPLQVAADREQAAIEQKPPTTEEVVAVELDDLPGPELAERVQLEQEEQVKEKPPAVEKSPAGIEDITDEVLGDIEVSQKEVEEKEPAKVIKEKPVEKTKKPKKKPVKKEPEVTEEKPTIEVAGDKSIVSGQEINVTPTEKQKEAENYKQGHVTVDGLNITIENPVGTERKGTDETGKEWSVEMKSDYGKIMGTTGIDKDHIDIFVKPGYEGGNEKVHVVYQNNPNTGKFDEHKVMLGFNTEEEAKAGYLENYEKDWKGLGTIQEMTIDEFKEWSKKPTREPVETKKTGETLPVKIEAVLKEGKVDNKKLFQIADEHYGGTWQEGKYDPREVYDATEEAMNRVVQSNPSPFADFNNPEKTLKNLLDLTDRLPRQTIRSTEQIELQQFSTPPGEAFVAVAVSGIEEGMNVLEPSAGTGNIATMAKLKGGNVVVNEIAERRKGHLKSLGFKVYDVDGEQLHNMLPDEVQPDVIVMNPPFSATGGRVKAHKTKFGARHVEQALLRLNDGGRLVAIVGRGMAHDRPTFLKWWEGIEKKYNVRANIGMSGKFYGKLGTTFDNQILVIDKTGPTPGDSRIDKIKNIITDESLSPEKALEVLKPLSKEDISGRIKDLKRKGKPDTEKKGGTEVRETPTPGVADTERGKPTKETAREPERGKLPDVAESEGRKPGTAGEERIEGTPERKQETPDREPSGVRERGDTDDTGRIERTEGERPSKLEEEEGGVYAKYRVQKAIYSKANPHPANVVESASLASVEPPDVTYTPNIPKEVVEKGNLSDIQLEAITYAGQRHSQELPDGKVPEYWIGDGCVAGSTRVFNPVTGKHVPIEEISGETHVLSLTEKGFVVRRATASFIKGVAELYEVEIENGNKVTVTDNHKFLTPFGWKRILDGILIGDVLACLENGHFFDYEVDCYVHEENGPNYYRKPQDCLFDYSACCRRYDEQSHLEANTFQDVSPLQGDAHEHNHPLFCRDGQSILSKHIHRHPNIFHHSRSNSFQEEIPFPSLTECRVCENDVLTLSEKHLTSPQFHVEKVSPHRSISEEHSHQAVSCYDHLSYNKNSRWNRIRSIKHVGIGLFWDIWVPGPQNYLAEGIIHHNTGIGKGREIAGIIYDNWNKGRKKAVWVSISKDLFKDARRDLDGVGVPAEMIRQGSLKVSDSITMNEGIVFTQYTTLRQNWNSTRDRFEQLKKWLGKDFDGVIVFDESHQMKNAQITDMYGGEKVTEGSDQGAMGLHLKDSFPKARFVNVSATGATHPTNLGYMSRMGLWGPGAPFSNFTAFLSAMNQGGVGAMEMLSRDLKAIGAYNSRSISYKGVDYDQVTHNLTEDEIKMYDRVADLWSEIMQKFEEGMESANMTKREAGNTISQFYSTQQRFFLQYMISLQLPDMIKDAEQQLKDGNSVVISLYSTNEQAVKNRVARAIAEDVDIENLSFSSKEMIVDLIERHFPVNQYEEKTDPVTNKTIRVPVKDSAGNPVINKENLEKRNKLIDTLVDYELPGNPFDVVVNHFGPKKIAEISGRKERLEGGKLVKRKLPGVPNKAINDAETANFQSGKKKVAIISGAASTGISLHSDMKAGNKQRRVFYALQLSWSADQQMQSFGRVHRSFQKTPPIIKMVSTNVAGQKRLINTISKRLASLGAVSSGTRQAYTGSLFDVEDITDDYGRAALQSVFRTEINKSLRDKMGLNDSKGNLKNGSDTNVEGFLNRIMALPFETQNDLFEKFYNNYTELVQQAKEKGTFDTGVQKISAKNLRASRAEETIYTHEQSGAKTNLVTLEGEVKIRKMKADSAESLVKSRTFGKIYYVTNNRSKRSVLIYHSENDMAKGKATVLNTRGNSTKIDATDVREKYTQLERDVWKKEWDKQYKEIPDTETTEFNLITGAVFPIYEKLFSNTDFRTGIYKASTKQKDYIGILIPQNQLTAIKQNLGIGAQLSNLNHEEILGLIENNKSVIQLDNGWTVGKTFVRGRSVIKVDPKGKVISREEAELIGLESYVVDYKRIHFIPLDNSYEVMEKLLKQHKAIKDITNGVKAFDAPPFKEADNVKASEAITSPTDIKEKTDEQQQIESMVDVARKTTGDKNKQMKAVKNIETQIQHNAGGKKKGSGWLNPFEYAYFKAKEIAWPIIKMRKILQKEWGESIKVYEKKGDKITKITSKDYLLNKLDYAVDKVRGASASAQQYLKDYYEPIFEPLKGKSAKERGLLSRTLSQYLVAKRTEWLYDNKSGYEDAGIAFDDSRTIVDFIESGDHPQSDIILGMAKKIWKYNRDLIDIKYRAGVIDDQLVQNLREPYYVPFFRDIDTGIHKPSAPMKLMFTATSTGIKRIKGSKSGHKIIDPLQLMISSTHETIVNAARVGIAQNIVDIAEENADVFGGLITKLPPKWIKAGNIEHRIQVDASLREQIDDMIQKLGVKVKTAFKLGERGVKGSKKRLGQFDSFNQEIRILYGATESTRAHELGHALDETYPWIRDRLTPHKKELEAIADSRYEGQEVPLKFTRYVRQMDEKIAEFISLYLSNRPLLKRMAPNAVKNFEQGLNKSDIKELKKIKPSNVKEMEVFEEANWVLDHSIPQDEDVVSLRKEGKLVHYRMPIEMALAIKNLHPKQIPMWLKWTIAIPTRSLRFWAVTGNPDFFVPNITRDQIDAAHNTKVIPFVDWFIGAKHYLFNSDLYKMYLRRGGGMESLEAGITGVKTESAGLIYGSKAGQFLDPFYWKNRGILKGTADLSMYAIRFPMKPIVALAELSEQGTRLGVFRRDLLSSGVDLNNLKAEDAEMAISQAVHAARQSTLDFQRFGYSGKIPNEIIPFINASLEGLDRFARAWAVPISEGKVPVRPIMYTALLYAIYAALTAWNRREEEEYKNISSREKSNNWIIMTGKGDGTYYKIPKGHITKLVLNVGQMIYESIEGLANKTGWGIAVDLFGEISPVDQGNILPVTAKLIIEPIVNYDFYWQNQIERTTHRSLPPGHRFKTRTSETLKSIGKALNISPIMMQHEVNVAMGGGGRNLLWVADWVLGTAGVQKPPHFDVSEATIVRRFYGKTEEWKADAASMIRDIDKRIYEIKKAGKAARMRKLRSMGFSPKEVQDAIKASDKELEKLERKKNELKNAQRKISSMQGVIKRRKIRFK